MWLDPHSEGKAIYPFSPDCFARFVYGWIVHQVQNQSLEGDAAFDVTLISRVYESEMSDYKGTKNLPGLLLSREEYTADSASGCLEPLLVPPKTVVPQIDLIGHSVVHTNRIKSLWCSKKQRGKSKTKNTKSRDVLYVSTNPLAVTKRTFQSDRKQNRWRRKLCVPVCAKKKQLSESSGDVLQDVQKALDIQSKVEKGDAYRELRLQEVVSELSLESSGVLIALLEIFATESLRTIRTKQDWLSVSKDVSTFLSRTTAILQSISVNPNASPLTSRDLRHRSLANVVDVLQVVRPL